MDNTARKQAAAMLTAFVSKISRQPWSDAHTQEAEAVVEAIASAVRAEPSDHAKAVDAERGKQNP